MHDFLKKARELADWSIQHRRHLHRFPELSLKEQSTSDYCQKVLKDLGYQIQPCWGYGFTADLINPSAKKTIAWRADMDALPVQEKNTHEFVSQNPGCAHVCGHDGHMTIALTAARILAEMPQPLPLTSGLYSNPAKKLLPAAL
jgi:metal-dependent amidase/aminoacylase/carboxypeptidase family protein